MEDLVEEACRIYATSGDLFNDAIDLSSILNGGKARPPLRRQFSQIDKALTRVKESLQSARFEVKKAKNMTATQLEVE